MKVILSLTMNPAVDTSSSAEHIVADRKLRCMRPRREPGGGGINVSRAVRRLGGKSLALFPAGGTTGQLLRDLLAGESINLHPVPITGETRENLTIREKSSDRQYRFIMPGPELSRKEWLHCLEEIATVVPKPDFIVASGSLPPGVPDDFFFRVSEVARQLGARVILDTSGEPLRQAIRTGVYLLKPNMRELEEIDGQEITNEAKQEQAASRIIQEGWSEIVLVSLGAAGAILVTGEGAERLRAPSVPVKSKVGAGDSMVAGLVLKLAQGSPLRDASRFGVAAGSAAVMTPGSELCRKEDAEALYERLCSEGHEGRV